MIDLIFILVVPLYLGITGGAVAKMFIPFQHGFGNCFTAALAFIPAVFSFQNISSRTLPMAVR